MADLKELSEKRLCSFCISDQFLRNDVDTQDKISLCNYCQNEDEATISIGNLSQRIDEAFSSHFERTSDQADGFAFAMMKDKEIDYQWEQEGQPVVYAIMDAANIPENAAADVQAILEDRHSNSESAQMGEQSEYSSEAYYEHILPNDPEWELNWAEFERQLKSEARFNSQLILDNLNPIFKGIEQFKTHDGKPVIVEAGPNEELNKFSRARVFQNISQFERALIYPDKELGPPLQI